MPIDLERLKTIYTTDFNNVYKEITQNKNWIIQEIKKNRDLENTLLEIFEFYRYRFSEHKYTDPEEENFMDLDKLPFFRSKSWIFFVIKKEHNNVYDELNKGNIGFRNIIFCLEKIFKDENSQNLLNNWFCKLLKDCTKAFKDAVKNIQKFSSDTDFKKKLQEYIDNLFLETILNQNINIENDKLLKNLEDIGVKKEEVLKKLLQREDLCTYYAYNKLRIKFKTSKKIETNTELEKLNFWFKNLYLYKDNDLLFLLNEGADSNRQILINKLKNIANYIIKQDSRTTLLNEKKVLENENDNSAKIRDLKQKIKHIEEELNQYNYDDEKIDEIFLNILSVFLKENLNYKSVFLKENLNYKEAAIKILNRQLKHIFERDYFDQENNIKNLLKAGATDTSCIYKKIKDLTENNREADQKNFVFLISRFTEYGIDFNYVNNFTDIETSVHDLNRLLNQIITNCEGNITRLKDNEKEIRALLIYGASSSSIDNISRTELGIIQKSLQQDDGFETFKFFIQNFKGQGINLNQTRQNSRWNNILQKRLNSWSEEYCKKLSSENINKNDRDIYIENIKFLLNEGAKKIILSNNNIFNSTIFGYILKKEIQNINVSSPIDILINFLILPRNYRFISCLDEETKNNLKNKNNNTINYYLENRR